MQMTGQVGFKWVGKYTLRDTNLRFAPQETSQYLSTWIDQLLLFVGDSIQQTIRNRVSIQLLYLSSIRPRNPQSVQHKAQTSGRILFAAKEHIPVADTADVHHFGVRGLCVLSLVHILGRLMPLRRHLTTI